MPLVVTESFTEGRDVSDQGATLRETPTASSEALTSDQLLLTPEEAARALRVGRTTVYALMKIGELRAVYIGRSCRLPAAELEHYVRRLQAHQPDRGHRLARVEEGRTTTGSASDASTSI
jgi:excisionase family DNA binding protein